MQIIKYVVLVCSLYFSIAVKSQHYNSFHYNQRDGLPQNSVNDLFWDTTGFLWICTEAGLTRFDGTLFKTFDVNTTTSIQNERFRWLNADLNHKLYASSADGKLFLIDYDRIRESSIKPNQYWYVKGTLPTGAELKKFTQFKPDRAKQLGLKWYPIRCAAINEKQTIILGNSAVYLTNNSRITDSIPFNFSAKGIIKIGPFNYVYSEYSIYLIETESRQLIPVKTSQPLGMITELFSQTKHKQAILLSKNRVLQIEFPLIGTELTVNYLFSINTDEVGEITEIKATDNCNTVAIGSKVNGLHIYKKSPFVTRRLKQEQNKSLEYYAHVPLNDSTVLTGNGDELTLHHDKLSGFNFKGNSTITLLYHNNTVWSIRGDSVYFQKKGSTRGVIICQSKPLSSLVALGDSVIAVGEEEMVIIHNNQLVDHFYYNLPEKQTGFENNPFAINYENGLLLVLGNHIYQADMERKKLTKKYEYKMVRHLLPYKNLLFGCSYGEGLFVIKNNGLKKLPVDKNKYLLKSHCLQIVDDKVAYISTNHGLFAATLEEIRNYIDDKSDTLHYYTYNEDDGIENSEFNGGCSPAGLKLNNGYLTFANMQGIVWFNPALAKAQMQQKCQLYLYEVWADDHDLPINDTIHLNEQVEKLVIKPGTIFWNNPVNIRARYMLHGINKDWHNIDLLKDNISFNNLPAGTYELVIEIVYGLSDNDRYTLSTIIIKEPHIYETIWFKIVAVIGVILLLYGLFALYYRRLLAKNLELELKVSVRTKELQEMNRELQVKTDELTQSVHVKNKLIAVISHDIVTPLKFIYMVCQKHLKDNLPASTKQIMSEIHDTSSKLYDNAQNVLNWIRVQNNQIRLVISNLAPFALVEDIAELLQDMAHAKGNTITNEINPDDVIRTDKTILSIIIQNIISNAVKYNENTNIVIKNQRHGNKFILTIADTGVGISEEQLKKLESMKHNPSIQFNENAEGTGLGFVIIFEMARLLQADIQIESKIEKGTAVTIILTV